MKFTQEALFGGAGRVTVEDLLRGAVLPPFREVLECALEPGGHVGAHRQEHFAEIVLFWEGEGQAVVQGVAQPVRAGSLILLPLGHALELRNPHPEAWLRYFIVKAG